MISITEKIKHLKREKNVLVLAHYYQHPEVKEIADYVGDSYELSRQAMQAPQQQIVFCGVRFMAESAKVLSPKKKILLSNADAGCPMADMAIPEKVLQLQAQYPDAASVCYINSPIEVKALCDVCVTSGNAVDIISHLPQKQILFLPDQNLAGFVAAQCPEKEIIRYPGYCIVHNRISSEDIREMMRSHPKAKVIAHPECRDEVTALADFVGSTKALLGYVDHSEHMEFIIVTEEGLRYELEQHNPDKKFYFPERMPMICTNMKKTDLEDVLWALAEDNEENTEIHVNEEIRLRALGCMEKMHALTAKIAKAKEAVI